MIRLDCDGVLFDCDGVLVDSDASVDSAWHRWAIVRGLDPADVLPMVHGRRSSDTVELLAAPADQANALALIDRYEIEDARAVRAIPGARELTATIPRARWAVVTSGNRELASARLRAAGFDLPRVLVTADDVERGKPDPQGYLLAAAQLGLAPAATIVLEDAVAGIQAARAARVGTIIGVGGRGLERDADILVADLRQITWREGALHLDVNA